MQKLFAIRNQLVTVTITSFQVFYARIQIFIQLSPTMTTLCHVKCDHPACIAADGGHFERDGGLVVMLNMALLRHSWR